MLDPPMKDTPKLGRSWCPTCEPECDPTREILDVRFCEPHRETDKACPDDALAKTDRILVGGTTEADGHDCREFMKLIRRSGPVARL